MPKLIALEIARQLVHAALALPDRWEQDIPVDPAVHYTDSLLRVYTDISESITDVLNNPELVEDTFSDLAAEYSTPIAWQWHSLLYELADHIDPHVTHWICLVDSFGGLLIYS